ncbi:MAG TPA: hypothetical protein VFN91_14540 [Myxococcaceae bacterium]|nr:hypothetical protein [Myxococcaceae bacterium]
MTTTTQTHPIEVRTSRALIAAFIWIIALGVLALVAHVDPPAGWGQLPPSGGATEFAQFGD